MKNDASILTNGPLVTVYIPCRNYGRFLAQAVESVLAQLYRNWELFIVDEASEDDSAALAAHLASRHPDKIQVLRNESPIGLQRIANLVLERASGQYFVRLDADDWFEESALMLMVAKLESDPGLGLVYGNYFYTAPDGRVIGLERRRRLGEEDKSGHLPPHGACTMVRTRLLKAVGGYSVEFDAQDGWELWHKLSSRAGAASLEAPLFYYRQHGNSLSRNSQRLLDARARILARTREKLEGSYHPRCLAVIPVRESYPGFEGVPYREIGGRSLIEWAVLSAQEASGVSEVAISTSSRDVLEFAQSLVERGAIKPVELMERPTELSGTYVPFRDILLYAARTSRERHGVHPDIVLFLSLHAPLRRAQHVDKAIDVLRIHTCDSVVSVCEERRPILRHGTEGLELINPGRFDDIDYEREKLYRFNGAVLGVWSEVLLEGGLFGDKIGSIEMTPQESVEVKPASESEITASRFQTGEEETL
jgi:glycosyltransferase involved in cell wall biosynthesis